MKSHLQHFSWPQALAQQADTLLSQYGSTHTSVVNKTVWRAQRHLILSAAELPAHSTLA
jgi:hypothetical protein